jgi:hypothetical protein
VENIQSNGSETRMAPMVKIMIGTTSFIERRSTPGRLFVGAILEEVSVGSVSEEE